MKLLRVGLVFAIGFILGAAAFHPRTAVAQARYAGILLGIGVKQVNVGSYTRIDTVQDPSPHVIGFSCVPDSGGDVKCYVATQ